MSLFSSYFLLISPSFLMLFTVTVVTASSGGSHHSSFLFPFINKQIKKTSSFPQFNSFSSSSTPSSSPSSPSSPPPPPPSSSSSAYFYPINDYLILPNSRRYCEGNTILLATASRDSPYKSTNEARVGCSGEKSCSFFSSSSSLILNYPLPITFTNNILPNTGANWFCRGDDWCRSTKAIGWVTLVKGDQLRVASLAYDVHLNTFIGGCEGNDVIKKIRRINDINAIKKVLNMCQEEEECGFLMINFASEEDPPNRVRQPQAILCKGAANEWRKENGFVTFTRKNLTAEIGGELVTLRPIQQRGRREGSGSITQDNFFNSLPKGTLVPALLKELP